ncbi:DUF7550 family protein [Halorhabdus amylolytica]|uniref:DUF7550 family protein n=1 Tax=Halorhabdus amylolytica TaxID=2559573 RepID=UPI0010A9A240|nr:hypothetical protein [Halorhabdus amylolytica]
MSDGHAEERPEYDPTEPEPPAREPPLRSTAPQGEYTTGQVATGFAIAIVGLALTFGLALLLA